MQLLNPGLNWVSMGPLPLVTGRTALNSGPGVDSDHTLARAPEGSFQKESGERSGLWR